MDDTIVDQVIFPLSKSLPVLAQASDGLLLPDNPADGLLGPEDWHIVAAQLQLSSRELSVAVLMFEGKSRFQIERRLKVAGGTVRVYVDRLFAKLNVRDRLGMALRVLRVHLGNQTVGATPTSHKAATCESDSGR